jgi:hypothetical protein
VRLPGGVWRVISEDRVNFFSGSLRPLGRIIMLAQELFFLVVIILLVLDQQAFLCVKEGVRIPFCMKFFLTISLTLSLLFSVSSLKAVPDFGMDDVQCWCGAYKEQCEPHSNEDCDVSNQMFCDDVCVTGVPGLP